MESCKGFFEKKRSWILLLAASTLLLLAVLGWNSYRKSLNTYIELAHVEKIEYLYPFSKNGKRIYTDKNEIAALVAFFNSFDLKERYDWVDCNRMPMEFKIFYQDGSADSIVYRYTSLVFNGRSYAIDLEKTKELDRLMASPPKGS